MKKAVLFFLSIFVYSTVAQGKELKSFDDMLKLLKNGKPLSFLIDLTQCELDEGIAFHPFHSILLQPQQYTLLDDAIVTLQSPILTNRISGKMVEPSYAYTEFRIKNKNNQSLGYFNYVEAHATTNSIIRTYSGTCTLGNGYKVFSNTIGGKDQHDSNRSHVA